MIIEIAVKFKWAGNECTQQQMDTDSFARVIDVFACQQNRLDWFSSA